MFSTYPYPPGAGFKPTLPDVGSYNQVQINGPYVGQPQGEYINGSYDDKEHAPDMGPACCPVAAYMTSGKRKMYFKGTLIRFTATTKESRSRSRQLETKAPVAFANAYVPGENANGITFVAPLAETQELMPMKSQHINVAVGAVSDVLVGDDSPSFSVFPGDRIYARITPNSVVVTTEATPTEIGIATHYHEHRPKAQSTIRVCLK